MNNQKSTKSALITSVIALLLCFAMLFGTTFAWFTDEVVNSNNIIKTGTLKIGFYHSDKYPANDATDWTDLSKETEPVFSYNNWEPGYMDVHYFKVKNLGSLALKYTMTIIPEGTVDNVAEVLDVYYAPEAINIDDSRDLVSQKLTKIGTVADVLKGKAGTVILDELVADDKDDSTTENTTDYATMVIKMQETADNKYQEKQVGTDFDIRLIATQLTYERDSFDENYDTNAAFSAWDGTDPAEMPATLVVDGETQTVHVKDAAAFAYLSTLSANWVDLYTDGSGTAYTNYANGAGANYYYSGEWTVSLETDIDLNNYKIAPVEIMFGQSTGATAFEGNNHVIRNINATTGLFADGTRATYSNLVLMNVKAEKGALTGVSNSSINNVTVKNATISGTDYVGGLVGRVFGNVTNCEVIDSSVRATGKEAGGLIGYAETNSKGSVIANNTVNNVSVYAGNRAAGLVAQPNVNIKVYNNTVDTVTVGVVDASAYAAGAIVSNALAPENVYDNTVINANIIGNLAMVNDSASLKTAIKNDTTIYLSEGVYSLPTLSGKEGVTIDAAEGTVVGGESASTGFGGNFGKDTTIKNITFNGTSNGVRYSYANGGTSVFENCTFAGDSIYGFHIDQSNGATFIFNNCTFSGFNAFAGDLVKVEFNNCTFLHNGNYGHTNIWSVGYFNNCTFGEGVTYSPGSGGGTIYIDGVEQ